LEIRQTREIEQKEITWKRRGKQNTGKQQEAK
jgi:hypothetical protein